MTVNYMEIAEAWKEIKAHLGRARNYLNKRKAVRAIVEVNDATQAYIFNEKHFSKQQKIEFEVTVFEMVKGFPILPELKPYLKKPINYKRGNERSLYMQLARVVKKIQEDMESGHKKADVKTSDRKAKGALLDKLQNYLNKGDMLMAGSTIKKIVAQAQEEGNKEVICDIADRYYLSGMWKETVEYAEKAIRTDPKNMRAYKILVNSHRKLKDYKSAVAVYKRALNTFGKHASIYVNLAKLYQEMGKSEMALEAVKIALKLDPDNLDAKEYYMAHKDG